MDPKTNSKVTVLNDGRYVCIGSSFLPEHYDIFDFCIHHGPCNDGLTASWAVQQSQPDICMIAQSPGCQHLFNAVSTDYIQNKRVVFVDICPTREILDKVLKLCSFVLILDHHETSKDLITHLVEDTVPNNLEVLFDMDRAGCHIAWDYFRYDHINEKKTPRPWFLDYIGDGDLWYPSEKKQYNNLPDSRFIVKGLNECGHLESRETLQKLYDTTGNHLNMAHDENCRSIIKHQLIPIGKLAKSKANKRIADIAKHAYLTEYIDEDGQRYYAWMVSNNDYTINSDLGHQLLDKPIVINTRPTDDVANNCTDNVIQHYPGFSLDGLSYEQAATLNMDSQVDTNTSSQIIMSAFSIIIRGYDPIKNALMVSMRGGSKCSPNVAKICARFGGGGHPNASGATIPIIDYRQWFNAVERI